MTQAIFNTIETLTPSLTALFAKIRDDSRDGEGVTRDAFGPRETQAGETVAAFAKRHGFETSRDHGGNLHITPPGQMADAPEIVIGSHLDSVPVGGNYDGLAGVLAGVAVLTALQQSGATRLRKIRVLGFRGEESPWFGHAYLGSRLMLGDFTHADLAALRRFDTGKTLAEHIAGLGIELPKGTLGPTVALDNMKAYFEMHIEQAPLLENMQRPLGIATAIRGNIRYPFAKCLGGYAHSGAMPRRFRRDALIATAKLVAFADDRWQELIEAGNEDLVFTCGIFQTDSAEHSMTKVPGDITFSLNIGGIKNDVMDELHRNILGRAAELAKAHDVTFEFGKRAGTPAVDLDAGILKRVVQAGHAFGMPPFRMPTVGHDAAMFQRRGIPTSVLLLRNANGSHNPKEHMEMADFEAGAKVLASAIDTMCRE
jgi:beta-ureidopropionase / N-carbamoyl-L-amino-acid hydrolase